MSRDRNSRNSSFSSNWKKKDFSEKRDSREKNIQNDFRSSQSHQNGKKNTSRHGFEHGSKGSYRPVRSVSFEQIKAEEEAIRAFKAEHQGYVCSVCGKNIEDLTTALTNRGNSDPIHFDCAIEILSKEEKLSEGDKITYIGQGRFGILNFPNVHDMKHFTIKKIIDWEKKEEKDEWRSAMAELYSQVK